MGAISGLLLLPLMAPVWGFTFVLERLRDEAEAVRNDEGRAFAELIDLSMRRSAGQLSEADYAEQETELLERLSSIRDYRDELQQSELDADDVLLDDELDADEEVLLDAEQDVDEYALLLAEPEVGDKEW